MNIGHSTTNVFGGPIWASGPTASAATSASTPGATSGASGATGLSAAGLGAAGLGAAGMGAAGGGATAPATGGGLLGSLSSELQSWLTALQNSQSGAGDTTAAANAVRYGIGGHHGGRHHHGASAGNAGAGSPPGGSNPAQGTALPAAAGAATGATDADGTGMLGDRLATQVMQAMQTYGSGAAAQATTGALLTTG